MEKKRATLEDAGAYINDAHSLLHALLFSPGVGGEKYKPLRANKDTALDLQRILDNLDTARAYIERVLKEELE